MIAFKAEGTVLHKPLPLSGTLHKINYIQTEVNPELINNVCFLHHSMTHISLWIVLHLIYFETVWIIAYSGRLLVPWSIMEKVLYLKSLDGI